MLLKLFKKKRKAKKSHSISLEKRKSTKLEKPKPEFSLEQTPLKLSSGNNPTETDDITADLARRIGTAIDEWKHKYQLENLSDKIALEQAITVIRIMKNTL